MEKEIRLMVYLNKNQAFRGQNLNCIRRIKTCYRHEKGIRMADTCPWSLLSNNFVKTRKTKSKRLWSYLIQDLAPSLGIIEAIS